MTEPQLGQALVEEATKKSALIWVRGSEPARALWHIWHEGAALLVGDGPGEQPLPGLVDGVAAEVTVRSKDKGGRLVAWTAASASPGGKCSPPCWKRPITCWFWSTPKRRPAQPPACWC